MAEYSLTTDLVLPNPIQGALNIITNAQVLSDLHSGDRNLAQTARLQISAGLDQIPVDLREKAYSVLFKSTESEKVIVQLLIKSREQKIAPVAFIEALAGRIAYCPGSIFPTLENVASSRPTAVLPLLKGLAQTQVEETKKTHVNRHWQSAESDVSRTIKLVGSVLNGLNPQERGQSEATVVDILQTMSDINFDSGNAKFPAFALSEFIKKHPEFVSNFLPLIKKLIRFDHDGICIALRNTARENPQTVLSVIEDLINWQQADENRKIFQEQTFHDYARSFSYSMLEIAKSALGSLTGEELIQAKSQVSRIVSNLVEAQDYEVGAPSYTVGALAGLLVAYPDMIEAAQSLIKRLEQYQRYSEASRQRLAEIQVLPQSSK